MVHATASSNHVTLANETLTIDGLQIESPSVIAAARDRSEAVTLDAWTTEIIELGARAATLTSSASGLFDLQREVQHLTSRVAEVASGFSDQVAATVTAASNPETGTITTAVRAELGSLSTSLRDLVAGEDAPVREALARTLHTAEQRLIAETQRLSAQQAANLRAIVDLGDATTPLGSLRATVERLDRSLNDLRSSVAVNEATEAERARGTAKGADFETAIGAVLAEIAHTAGDDCDAVGTAEGTIPGCKKGDIVISLAESPQTNIVVEVKDRKQGVAAWRRYMAQAAENRSAQVSIGIVRSPDQVPCGSLVQVVGNNTFLIAVDPEDQVSRALLIAVYRIARARAVALANDHVTSDRVAVEAAIRSAQEHLEGTAEIVRRSRRAASEAEAVAVRVASLTEVLEADLEQAMRAATVLSDGEAF